MPVDHRQLSWYFADRARAVKFDTVRRTRSALWNYDRQLQGLQLADIPTDSFRFTHRFDGLLQRLGAASKQDKVFSHKLMSAVASSNRHEVLDVPAAADVCQRGVGASQPAGDRDRRSPDASG